MIKLATMSSACPDWTLDEVVAGMKRHGYEGFEPRVEWGHASGIEVGLTADERKAVRERMEGEGLEVCCIATGARMAEPDPAERAKHLEGLKGYIDLAADLGCGLLRTFGGARDRGREFMAVVDYVVEGYAQVLDQAQARDVTLLLETHDDWCASAPVRAVVEQAGHPNLKVLWDFMHSQRVLEKPEQSFQVLGEYTRHTHAHDGQIIDGKLQVSETLGDGLFDHEIPLRLLFEAGFSGYFSVEVIHQPGSEHDADRVLGQYAEQFRAIMAGL
jgi:sugar phosphate isomerase/epimerase